MRCAPYATFGTPELAAHALAALQGRNACLLANHGMIVVGPSLAKAMWLAVELEAIAEQYCLAIADTARGFFTYGLQDRDQAA